MDLSSDLVIRRCRADETPAVGAFYDSVVKHMDETDTNYPHWTYGVYPSAASAAARCCSTGSPSAPTIRISRTRTIPTPG